jgi:HEAT repeat protein
VPLFDGTSAEKGASSLVRNYRQPRESLTYLSYKVRLSAVINLYKLGEQDSSLRTLVIRDMLGMLKDEDPTVRLVAAVSLSKL